jgi:hypothetical protein
MSANFGTGRIGRLEVDALGRGRGAMPAYRIYVLDSNDHVAAPPHVVDCADDQNAIVEARQYLDERPIEVWQCAKFVVRLEPDK